MLILSQYHIFESYKINIYRVAMQLQEQKLSTYAFQHRPDPKSNIEEWFNYQLFLACFARLIPVHPGTED